MLSCLAKEPDDRPPSAEWLAARLAECETGEGWTPARARASWEASRVRAVPSARGGEGARTGTAPAPLRPAALKSGT